VWANLAGEEKLGCVEEEGKKELGWAAWGKRKGGGERPSLAGLQRRKERGKKKREGGPSPIRKGERKKLHSNAFEFEFKI
jgi:hypothetical protein